MQLPVSTCTGLLAAVLTAALMAQTAPAQQLQRALIRTGGTPLYGTYEAAIVMPDVPGNRFLRFVEFTFTSPGGRKIRVDGFYDGGDTWRARVLCNEVGTWTYSWSFPDHTQGGGGRFDVVGEKVSPGAHGHVRIDPDRPRFLLHEDGTPHYWYGGKWVSYSDHGPASHKGVTNSDHLTDAVLLAYLDACAAYDHNGLLLKIAMGPLEDDKFSWNLGWLARAEALVQEMGRRGIYCQVNIFDTWARALGKPFQYSTRGAEQVFNVWADGDEQAKENYLRTIIARFGGFYNVCWELGNEMEHNPNRGQAFQEQAEKHYIPWMRKHDPYNLPIGLSEVALARQTKGVDVLFVHQTHKLPRADDTRPWVLNELVGGWSGGALWRDKLIRDPANRLGYRHAFWRTFVRGGSGSSQATWLKITEPLNQAVHDVMGDQQRLRRFLESLPAGINEMADFGTILAEGPKSFGTRGKGGQAYVVYFDERASAGKLVLTGLPGGTYRAFFHDPARGVSGPHQVFTLADPKGRAEIDHPEWEDDAVLCVIRADRATE